MPTSHDTTTVEIWKDIPGYEGLYQVSNMGRVMKLKPHKRILVPGLKGKSPFQYLGVSLSKDKRSATYTVHKLVMLAFVGERPIDLEVNHIDTNKLNNRLSNLEYVTHKHNMEHASQNNLWGKLTKDERFEIIDLLKMGHDEEQIIAWYSITPYMLKMVLRDWRREQRRLMNQSS